jgi:hypothetical protein
MVHSGHQKIKCFVDEIGTDPNADTFIHLRFGNNSIWCKLTNAHKTNDLGKTTRLYSKSMSKDRFLVGNLIGVFGKYPMRTVMVDSGFGISYVFDEILHSDINFIN